MSHDVFVHLLQERGPVFCMLSLLRPVLLQEDHEEEKAPKGEDNLTPPSSMSPEPTKALDVTQKHVSNGFSEGQEEKTDEEEDKS